MVYKPTYNLGPHPVAIIYRSLLDMILFSLAKVVISLSASSIVIYETYPIANTYCSLLDTRCHHYLDIFIIIK